MGKTYTQEEFDAALEQMRVSTLEEAAKVCDKISLRFFKDRCDPQQFVSDQCAAAIRGLK